jgi:hypothetical protein
MLSNTQLFAGILVGLLLALRWIVRGLTRRSIEAQIIQALDDVARAETHWQAVLTETNAPAYASLQLTFLDAERTELQAMLNKARAGERVTYDGIYKLEKLVAGYATLIPTQHSAKLTKGS